MRQMAFVLAAALMFAVISPAFAQPFADTPTNHWAYDAIAELAAKGLIEGYPDGTFKGDRAMTRYEMAMVVARLLARIESIQIPTPPPPEVTKADIDMILRLLNEFRAELAAKNVRLTAVEEELNAIKARLDNVRITGSVRFREDLNQWNPNLAFGFGSAPTLTGNFNPGTSNVSSNTVGRGNRPRIEFKLGFDGSVAPDIHFIAAIETAQGYQFFNSSNIGFGAGQNGQPQQGAFGMIDSAFIQWLPQGWAKGVDLRLGRFGVDTPCGPCYPIQFGPFGLVFNTSGDTWEDATFNSGFNVADGIWGQYSNPDWLNLHLQAFWGRVAGNIGQFSYASGEDTYGVDLNVGVFSGFTIGGYYVGNNLSNSGTTTLNQPNGGFSPNSAIPPNLWHVYGPGGGSFNPVTGRCPLIQPGQPGFNFAPSGPGSPGLAPSTSPSGIMCPAAGDGYGGYVQWDVIPGIHFDGEIAWWNDTTSGGGTDYGYQVAATANLQQLLNLGIPITVSAGWLYYGQNFYTPYGAAEADIWGWDVLYPGNAEGITGSITVTPIAKWTIYGIGTFGNSISNGMSFSEWEAGIVYQFATNASVVFKYRDLIMNSIDQLNVYRAQVDYHF